MNAFSLKSRAIVFAICAGAVAFILALAAASRGMLTAESAATAVIAAVICGALCWASAERALASTASALDIAIQRLARAADGDLQGEVPEEVVQTVPALADAMGRLFHQLHANIENVQRLAMFDPVTSLPNRINFRRSCERMLATLPEDGRAALLFIDLDRFKQVNDTLGHASGDMLLAMVANRLRAVADRFADKTGERPLIGRLAGDEFTMFVPDLIDGRDAARVGEALLYALSETFELNGNEVDIGASVGIARYPEHGRTLNALMRAADAAMYHAKAMGRGRSEPFNALLAQQIEDRARLEEDLRIAIARDQFELVYQPQLSAHDGALVGAEALLRWRHPDGLRLPAAFLRRAEETGLIVEIGDWVVDNVAQTIARWGKLGIRQRLAINVSGRQLDQAAFFRRLRQAMHRASAPAHLLELEINETQAMHCLPEIIDAIVALRSDGASIAVDDFGTGYSNIARLRELPIDRVKLHRSVTAYVVDEPGARAIAQAVIGLVHGLGCEAVAVGIETAAQADVLRVIGCDVLQGFALAQPMDEGDFLAWAHEAGRQRIAV